MIARPEILHEGNAHPGIMVPAGTRVRLAFKNYGDTEELEDALLQFLGSDLFGKSVAPGFYDPSVEIVGNYVHLNLTVRGPLPPRIIWGHVRPSILEWLMVKYPQIELD